jgi:hypothetical protein
MDTTRHAMSDTHISDANVSDAHRSDSSTATASATAPADDNTETLKRDYIIFGVAILFVSAGLTDGLYRGFGLPLWAAVPLGATFWAGAEYVIYRKYQEL